MGVLLLDDADRIRTAAVTAPSATALEAAQERLLLGPGVDVQRLRRVVTVSDLAEDPAYRPLWDEVAGAGVRGVLSAPVWVGHEVVGNLNAITERVHEWSDAERRAGAAYASLVGSVAGLGDPGGPASRHGGNGADRPVSAKIDSAALAASLRRLQEDRAPAVLEQSLQQLVTACVELFGVDGSGVMLADEGGDLRYAVATDPTSKELEDAQLATGEGPCVDTYVNDELALSPDIYSDDRWQRLTERLAHRRVRGVLGVPVKLSGVTVGSLDVFRDGRDDWDESEQQALSRYAEIGGALLTAAVAAEQSSELAAQLTYAIQHRAPIERGVGYLMARDRIGQTEAFNRLRSAARDNRRKIGDVARELLSTGRLPGERR